MKLTTQDAITTMAQRAIKQFGADDTSAIFLDSEVIQDRCARLKRAFPVNALHAVAVKSNPLAAALNQVAANGMGFEAASFAEVHMGLQAAGSGDKLVFDSPAKTNAELAQLAESCRGLHINADNFAELERIEPFADKFTVGLRVNPVMAIDAPAALNVSRVDSKFGVNLHHEAEILQAFERFQFLSALHVHVGSSLAKIDLAVNAIRRVVDLAQRLKRQLPGREIHTIDIGGGFPVNYGDGAPYLVEDYAEKLRETCPELWSGEFRCITEFGRYVHGHAAWLLSRVEYVKAYGASADSVEGTNLIIQSGADVFLRECYQQGQWPHKMILLDKFGVPKPTTALQSQRVAGPLCFAGDVISHEQPLPRAEAGDWLAIRDVGANTFSLFSRHCSRPFPSVYEHFGEDADSLKLVKPRESLAQVMAFWS